MSGTKRKEREPKDSSKEISKEEYKEKIDEILNKAQYISTLLYETSKLIKDLPDFESWRRSHKPDEPGYISLASITDPGHSSASRLWMRARSVYEGKYDVNYWEETTWDPDSARWCNKPMKSSKN